MQVERNRLDRMLDGEEEKGGVVTSGRARGLFDQSIDLENVTVKDSAPGQKGN